MSKDIATAASDRAILLVASVPADRGWFPDARQHVESQDMVLKTSLLIADVDVRFRVSNFTQDNTTKVEAAWDQTRDSLLRAATLIDLFGFSSRTLTADSVVVLLAHYPHRRGRTAIGGTAVRGVDSLRSPGGIGVGVAGCREGRIITFRTRGCAGERHRGRVRGCASAVAWLRGR